MAAPLVERNTGDVIPASDHNDVKDYVEDGTYRINTLSLNIGGIEIIDSSGNITTNVGTVDGIDIATDVAANNAKVTNQTHTGEVTGATELTIADNVIDEANMKISNDPTDDYVLTADSTATGGWKWAEASGGINSIVEDTTPELGGELDAGAHSIGFTEGSATGTGETTIDWRNGNKFKFTFGAQNETFTFINPSNPCNLLLVLIQDDTGSRTADFPLFSVKWAGGTPPTLSTAGNSIDIISFYFDGTNYYGMSSLDFVATGVETGVFGGGYTSSEVDVIDYVTIDTTGNATDFGDLTVARRRLAGCSSSTRGVFGGGYTGSEVDVIDYVTIASAGNATDFGDLTVARYSLAGCSSSTRGLFGGGIQSGDNNTIDYVTIASTGNATDFGDLSVARSGLAGCSSSTRGVFGGGNQSGDNNTIDYVTIDTTGNATDFGDLSVARSGLAGCSSSTRGLFAGGITDSPSNVIDYVTIASTGNATDFGDLSVARRQLAGCSSSTRGVFGGGIQSGDNNTIDYVTIDTTGNATDFGDLSVARSGLAGLSNCHGGL